jgi:hypothetical protein
VAAVQPTIGWTHVDLVGYRKQMRQGSTKSEKTRYFAYVRALTTPKRAPRHRWRLTN